MSQPEISYTLAQIEALKNNDLTYEIPSDILNIINHISQQVGAENYIKTPQFNTKNRNHNKQFDKEAWAAIRNFKVTERTEKQGVEKFLQELRGELNKITEKNFECISKNILEKMTMDLVNENKDKIADHIFEIASTNKFYSSIYAKLFKIIIDKFDFMYDVVNKNFFDYMNLFENIDSIDPNIDYNKFCDINKENERRKALSQFFVNLVSEEIIDKAKIVKIISNLFKMMFDYVKLTNKKAENIEIVENIFIIVKSIRSKLTSLQISEISEKINLLIAIKPSNSNSMSNKVVFKYMDLLEEL